MYVYLRLTYALLKIEELPLRKRNFKTPKKLKDFTFETQTQSFGCKFIPLNLLKFQLLLGLLKLINMAI